MKTLIVGASGATGKLLVEQLLNAGQQVKAIVRPSSKIPDSWNNNNNLTIIKSNIEQMAVDEMAKLLADCQAVASCLGHNLTLKGIYGKPRKLVTDTVRLLCEAALNLKPEEPLKFVLMNTAGNSNRDLIEPVSATHKFMLSLIRLFVPPHSDNENAADYLRVNIGKQNKHIKWVAVRPDTLINEAEVTEYTLHTSPTRSALFNPGKTSRINIAHFMVQLITDEETWIKWNGQMPVIYNVEK